MALGWSAGCQWDRQIIRPYTYLERSLSNPWQRNIRQFRIKIKSSANPDAVGKQIEGHFKSRYGNTGQFTANSNAKVMDQMNLFLTIFPSLLTAASA